MRPLKITEGTNFEQLSGPSRPPPFFFFFFSLAHGVGSLSCDIILPGNTVSPQAQNESANGILTGTFFSL